jgi:hypothetical protein
MLIKKTTWYILIVLVFVSLLSCSSRYQSHEDEFYNDTGEYPSARIPLIKPCYLYSREGNPWTLWLSTEVRTSSSKDDVYYVYKHVTDVRKLSVQNGVIMAYSPQGEKKADEGMQDLHWFVTIPDKKFAMGFKDEDDFF